MEWDSTAWASVELAKTNRTVLGINRALSSPRVLVDIHCTENNSNYGLQVLLYRVPREYCYKYGRLSGSSTFGARAALHSAFEVVSVVLSVFALWSL